MQDLLDKIEYIKKDIDRVKSLGDHKKAEMLQDYINYLSDEISIIKQKQRDKNV